MGSRQSELLMQIFNFVPIQPAFVLKPQALSHHHRGPEQRNLILRQLRPPTAIHRSHRVCFHHPPTRSLPTRTGSSAVTLDQGSICELQEPNWCSTVDGAGLDPLVDQAGECALAFHIWDLEIREAIPPAVAALWRRTIMAEEATITDVCTGIGHSVHIPEAGEADG